MKKNFSKILLISVLILFTILAIYSNRFNNIEKVFIDHNNDTMDTLSLYNDRPLLDSVIEYIDMLNLEHPDIVKAQMILESWYAKRFKGYNLFGMNVAKKRPTTAINKSGYAQYKSWEDSVLDYALFQAAYCRGLKRDQYFKYIGRNYAEGENYVRELKKIIDKHLK